MKAMPFAIAGVVAVLVVGALLALVLKSPSGTRSNANQTIESTAPQVLDNNGLVICDQARSAGQLTPDCNRKVSQTVVSCESGLTGSICTDPRLDSYSISLSQSAVSRAVSLGINNESYFSGWRDYAGNAGYEILYPPGWKVKDSGSILDIVPPEGKGYFRIIQGPVNETDAPQYHATLRTALLGGSNTTDITVIQNAAGAYNGQYFMPEVVYSVNASGLRHIAAQWSVNVDYGAGKREYAIVFTGPHEISLKYAAVSNTMVQTIRFGAAFAQQHGNMQIPSKNKCPSTTIPLSNGSCLDPGNYLG